jgi:hypothetical protein
MDPQWYDLIDLTIRVKRKTAQKGIQKLNFKSESMLVV